MLGGPSKSRIFEAQTDDTFDATETFDVLESFQGLSMILTKLLSTVSHGRALNCCDSGVLVRQMCHHDSSVEAPFCKNATRRQMTLKRDKMSGIAASNSEGNL